MHQQRRPFAVLVLVPAALHACAAAGSPSAGEDQLADWSSVMVSVIDPLHEEVLKPQARGRLEAMDLDGIARAAERSARAMALGHGRLARPQPKEFASLARQAEAWYREIETAARAGERVRVRELVLAGERLHCDRCHDVANR